MAQEIIYSETPTEGEIQAELNPFGWIIGDLNWTTVEKAICASQSEIVVIWILFCIELFVICLVLYGLCYFFKSDHAVPIFVLNLFITDIIQICLKPILNFCLSNVGFVYVFYIYIMSVLANIGFMVCIAFERYVMIKYPVWYRHCHSLRHSVVLILLVWALSCSFIGADFVLTYKGHLQYAFLLYVIPFLMPYPLVVFCFVGSWRALSHSVSVTPDEQKRILRILILVLFNYTVLFLPGIVNNIVFAVAIVQGQNTHFNELQAVSGIMLYLNPLADSLLYVFLREDANMLRGLCCKT